MILLSTGPAAPLLEKGNNYWSFYTTPEADATKPDIRQMLLLQFDNRFIRMVLKICIINKAINNNENLQPTKAILRARTSAVSQVISEGHTSCYQQVLWLLDSGQCQIHPQCMPQRSLWVTPASDFMYSSSQLLNLAAGWHHTFFPQPIHYSRHWGRVGLYMLLQSFISAMCLECWAGQGTREIPPTPGWRLFQPSLRRARRGSLPCRPGSHLHSSFQIQSMEEFISYQQPCFSLQLALQLSRLPAGVRRVQLLAQGSERCVHPGALNLEGCDSNHSQARVSAPNCFQMY